DMDRFLLWRRLGISRVSNHRSHVCRVPVGGAGFAGAITASLWFFLCFFLFAEDLQPLHARRIGLLHGTLGVHAGSGIARRAAHRTDFAVGPEEQGIGFRVGHRSVEVV